MTGVAFRDALAGEVVDTGLSIRMTKPELNTVGPRPAWDLVPLEKYWEHYPFFGVNRGRSMHVLGTRGCPYKCTFCSSPQMWTTKYVVREPEDVVDEIVEYVERYGVQNVNFVDLTAATNRKWTLGLCDALEARAPGHLLAAAGRHPDRGHRPRGAAAPLGHRLPQHHLRPRERLGADARDHGQAGQARQGPRRPSGRATRSGCAR